MVNDCSELDHERARGDFSTCTLNQRRYVTQAISRSAERPFASGAYNQFALIQYGN
jgi:hypothetical protein